MSRTRQHLRSSTATIRIDAAEHSLANVTLGAARRRIRQEDFSSHAVVLRALVGAELIKTYPADWRDTLQLLAQVDWRKRNRDSENICIIANSAVSNRQTRNATKSYLKYMLGLDLSESERKAIAHVLNPVCPVPVNS